LNKKVVSLGRWKENPYFVSVWLTVGTPGMILGSVVLVVEDEVVEEVLRFVVVGEGALVEEVELSAVVDTARLVDVPAVTVVDEEPPPPHALKRRRPATTIRPGTMRTTRLLIRGSLRSGELPHTVFPKTAVVPAHVPTGRSPSTSISRGSRRRMSLQVE
jgi:hypothetical protein